MVGPFELYRRARAVVEAAFGKHTTRCWECGAVTGSNTNNDDAPLGRAVPCIACALEGKRWDRPRAQ